MNPSGTKGSQPIFSAVKWHQGEYRVVGFNGRRASEGVESQVRGALNMLGMTFPLVVDVLQLLSLDILFDPQNRYRLLPDQPSIFARYDPPRHILVLRDGWNLAALYLEIGRLLDIEAGAAETGKGLKIGGEAPYPSLSLIRWSNRHFLEYPFWQAAFSSVLDPAAISLEQLRSTSTDPDLWLDCWSHLFRQYVTQSIRRMGASFEDSKIVRSPSSEIWSAAWIEQQALPIGKMVTDRVYRISRQIWL